MTPAQSAEVLPVAAVGAAVAVYVAGCWLGNRRAQPGRDAAFDATRHTDTAPDPNGTP